MDEQQKDYLEEEKNLVVELKAFCDIEGKELDPKKSAQKFYEIAKLYRKRSPDKISLIKSVGLLNAVISRKPSNLDEVYSELDSVCKEILELAHAAGSNANLPEKAKELKIRIKEWRSEIHETFLQVKKKLDKGMQRQETEEINHIKELQEKISEEYTKIMNDIAKYSIDVMGEAPCYFTIAGMGSLAKKEITPFSDFEHIIVLEEKEHDEKTLEYFRWYSVVFHVVVLNLQETIIPSLDITSLNDSTDTNKSWFYDAYTPRGISFDGMMPHACKSPLGRQRPTTAKPFSTELIKPVRQMLEYLTSEEDLKNGYHLKDILMKTCFVFGDPSVYDQFDEGVKSFFENQSHDIVSEEIKKQIEEDLDNFATKFKLKNMAGTKELNVKQTVYRSSTLFVSAFGQIHKIHKSTCFGIIKGLAEKGIISEYVKGNLMFAVAFAFRVRLELYFDKDAQQDNLSSEIEIRSFLQLVGATDLIKHFQITYCLQAELCKELKMKFKYSYSHPKLLNVIICHVFGLTKFLQDLLIENSSFLGNELKPSSTAEKDLFIFEDCLKLLQEQIKILSDFNNSLDSNLQKNYFEAFNFFNMGIILLYLEESEDAADFLKYFAQMLKVDNDFVAELDNDIAIKNVLEKIENKVERLSLDENSQIYHKRLHRLFQRNFSSNEISTNIARMLDLASFYLHALKKFPDSKNCCEQALIIYENSPAFDTKNYNIGLTHDNIGMCLQETNEWKAALENHEKALEVYKKLPLSENMDMRMARVFENIGDCFQGMERYKKALKYHKKALLYYITIDLPGPRSIVPVINFENYKSIARVIDNIGECLRDLERYEEAESNHQSAFRIYQKLAADPDNSEDVAGKLGNIGDCRHGMGKYTDALNYYEQALSIYQNLSPNHEKDEEIAEVLDSMGESLRELKNYEEALDKHKEALKIYQNVFSGKKCKEIAIVIENIAECYSCMECHEDAVNFYKESLLIYKHLSQNNNGEKCKVAEIEVNIGKCYKNLKEYSDAISHYKEALQIYENTTSERDCEENNIAVVCKEIGDCYERLGQCDNAQMFYEKAGQVQPRSSSSSGTDSSDDSEDTEDDDTDGDDED